MKITPVKTALWLLWALALAITTPKAHAILVYASNGTKVFKLEVNVEAGTALLLRTYTSFVTPTSSEMLNSISGLAVVGDTIYVSGSRYSGDDRRIYKFSATTAESLGYIQTPGVSYLGTLAWDGNALWINQGDNVYQVDLAGNTLASFRISPMWGTEGMEYFNGKIIANSAPNINAPAAYGVYGLQGGSSRNLFTVQGGSGLAYDGSNFLVSTFLPAGGYSLRVYNGATGAFIKTIALPEGIYTRDLSIDYAQRLDTASGNFPPGLIRYVANTSLGTLRNDHPGWVGTQFTVGSSPLSVYQLGRMVAPGNTRSHRVKLVVANSGTDVPGGSVMIETAGGAAGQFRYGSLASPVLLAADTTYWLVSEETYLGDSWYDSDTTVTTNELVTNNGFVWSTGPGTWGTTSAENRGPVSVDFKFMVADTKPFVTGAVLGTLRNDYTGWVGMEVVVGPDPLIVTELGRMVAAGNTGVHQLKIVDAGDGRDVAGSQVTAFASGAASGFFRYASLPAAVTLAPGATYWVMSYEFSGGERWYDSDTTLTTTNAGALTGLAWGASLNDWHRSSSPNHSGGPVNFTYTLAPAPYITGAQLGTLRNDYTGWVGMQIVVGSTPLQVRELARMVAPGNTATHTVKLVNASDGSDVLGGAVSIATNGATAGQFKYGPLPAPVTLAAGTTYYVLSYEEFQGDVWYDGDTTLTTSAVAEETGLAWGSGRFDWHFSPYPDHSGVPVNFKYDRFATPYITSSQPGTLRNDYPGWVGMQIVVGNRALTVSELGRMVAPGNNGTHIIKLLRASDGLDVPGGSVTIATSGVPSGRFQYGRLPSRVVLAAGTTYWLMCQESAGGDHWYNWDTAVTTTGVAVDNAVTWGTGQGDWGVYPVANHAHGPLNLIYHP